MSALEDKFAAELEAYGLPAPLREYKFHDERRWRFDFAWPERERRIAVEIQGGLYSVGRHNRGAAMEAEFEKLNAAVRLGWQVYLFGPRALRRTKTGSSQALEVMWEVLRGSSRTDNGHA